MQIMQKNEKGAMLSFSYCHYRRNYVAYIVGTDAQYGFARKFAGRKTNMTSSGKNGKIEIYIGENDVVEYRDGNVYKGENEKMYFTFRNGKVEEISELDVRRILEEKEKKEVRKND